MGKLDRLKKILLRYGKIMIAFSGGCDSSFLLAFAVKVLGRDRVRAVTASRETFTSQEMKRCKALSKKFGNRHYIIHTREIHQKAFTDNSAMRCFYCKDEFLSQACRLAKKYNLQIADGANTDDLSEFRPGMKAAKKWHVRHPLLEAGMSKNDLRRASRNLGLSTADLPAQSCLATRIPHGERITKRKLMRIEAAEAYLRKIGIRGRLRVRTSHGAARIEMARSEKIKLFKKQTIKNIETHFKKIGLKKIL